MNMTTPTKEYGYITAITPEEIKALGNCKPFDEEFKFNEWFKHGLTYTPHIPIPYGGEFEIVKAIRRPIISPDDPDWELVGQFDIIQHGDQRRCMCSRYRGLWIESLSVGSTVDFCIKQCPEKQLIYRRPKQKKSTPTSPRLCKGKQHDLKCEWQFAIGYTGRIICNDCDYTATYDASPLSKEDWEIEFDKQKPTFNHVFHDEREAKLIFKAGWNSKQ